MREKLKVDGETLLIGHSSGAAAALRLLETDVVGACMLVAAYDSGLILILLKIKSIKDTISFWRFFFKNVQIKIKTSNINICYLLLFLLLLVLYLYDRSG